MKRIVLPVLSFVILSAFAVQDNLKDRMLAAVSPYVASELKLDFNKKENALTIIEIDTLTEKKRLQLKGLALVEELEIDHQPFIELQRYAVNQYMQLYKIHPVASVRQEIDQAVREYDELQKKAEPLMKELQTVIDREKKADDTKFVAYSVKALLKRPRVNSANTIEIKTDTLGILVNKAFEVIEKKDFIKG
ncbi:hypothetical protein [Myroides sp. DF42-4-2]|uniref:hypothetical protein n=1 Tax=unclassified Myroides TaxID=2642485 RepID=UPI002577D3AF|nr:hypothetical protein [Myroides sp. DF42-4-2]MDM1407453.1 hypothetical protein [Myroides sp. DF42-4-2]